MSTFAVPTIGQSTYQGIMRNASQKFNISLEYGQIFIIFLLSLFYMALASLGIDMFSKCKELEDKTIQQNLNKWLIATLAISITIPFTLVVTKVAGKNLTFAMMLLFAFMGIIGSATSLNWSLNCSEVETSKKVYSGINMASFTLMCLISLYMMRPKSN